MTTAVALQQKAEPNLPQSVLEDLLVPRLYLMQGLSKLVSKRKAAPGCIIKSTTSETLFDLDAGTPLRFIPFSYHRTWLIKKHANPNDSMGQWVATQPWIPGENDQDPREWIYQGVRHTRTLQLNVLALLGSDVVASSKAIEAIKNGEEPDDPTAASLLPVVITFQRTSRKAGTAITSHFLQIQQINNSAGVSMKPWVSAFYLSSEMVEDDHTYYVFKVDNAGKSTPDERAAADTWAKLIGTRELKVDAHEEEQDGQDDRRGTEGDVYRSEDSQEASDRHSDSETLVL